MQTGVSRGITIVLTIITFIGLVPVARAAHATNFLNALDSEVTNRLAHATDSADGKVLQHAAKTLGHNTKTLSADVTALAGAAKVLDTRFEDDATLSLLEESALLAYSTEAHNEVTGASVRLLPLFSNSIPTRVVHQFLQASNALAEFDANTNDLPSRAHSLARAFTKLRGPVAKIFAAHPGPPAMSPLSLVTSQNIQLESGQEPNKTIYYFHTTIPPSDPHGTRGLTYFANFANSAAENSEGNPGTWEYIHTGQATATLRCTANSPAGLMHDFLLTFTTTTQGTFTGSNWAGTNISGIFYID